MATQPEIQDDDLDLTEDMEVEDQEQDEENNGEEDGEEAVTFADEEPDDDTPLVKRLRQELRERDKLIANTRRQIQAEEPDIVVPPRPTIESCDWDQERLNKETDDWIEVNQAAAAQKQKREDAKSRQASDWQKITDSYQEKKAALRFADKNEAEQVALDALSGGAQAVIAKHASNPALLMYAIGKSPTKLAELARIDREGDPFAVLAAAVRMEGSLVTKKAARPPNPDTPVQGKTVSMTSSEKTLKKLEEEADKTGDRSKVIAYKRQIKEKAA